MHILEIPSFFMPHGGLFCLEQAKALKAHGHEVRILACTLLSSRIDKAFYFKAPRGFWVDNMDGIEVLGHYQHGIPKAVYINVTQWLRNVRNMYGEYVRQYGKPDIIHAHCCKLAGIAAQQIKKLDGTPYFITEHLSSGLFVKDFGKHWEYHTWLRPMLCDAYKSAQCVMPVSEELVDDLAPFFGKDYIHHTISNIIDTDFFAYRPRTSTEGRPYRYCCIAVANIHGKGYDILHDAWKGISNAELHIAGRGTDAEEMTSLFSDCNNVILNGQLTKEKVRDLLYSCDALVLPTRSEAQGLVILEAASTGIPFVSTEAIPRSIRIPNASFIAPIGDVEALHKQMIAVQSTLPSASFHDAVVKIASPDVVVNQLEEIFTRPCCQQ